MPPVLVADSFMDDERKVSYYDVVLPLYKLAQGRSPELIGTCFPIGIGIYLTAAHNFDIFGQVKHHYGRRGGEMTQLTREELLERQREMEKDRFLEGADVNLAPLVLDQAAIRRGELKALGFSLPPFVSVAYDFDLAVIFSPNDLRRNAEGQASPIPVLTIQETPVIGQKIEVAGFPGANHRIDVTDEGGQRTTAIGLTMIVNEGEIVELHPVMRDAGIAFYPCIQTTVNILPGHSGGPAFCKETLNVVGINSTGGFTDYGMISWIGKALDADRRIPATHFRLGQIGSLGCQLGLLITSPSRLRCLRSLVFPNLACLASAFDARKPTDPLVATPGEPYPGAPTPAGLGRAPTTW